MADHKRTRPMQPVEIYHDVDRKFIILTGHRRVEALRLLAQRGRHGFRSDMKFPVVEEPKSKQEEDRSEAKDGEQ